MSPDATWVYAWSGEGKLFIWHPNENLSMNATPSGEFHSRGRYPMITFAAPSKTHALFCINDILGNGILVKDILTPDVLAISLAGPGYGRREFSHSGRKLIYECGDYYSGYYICGADLSTFPKAVVTRVRVNRTSRVEMSAALSPDERLFVFLDSDGHFKKWPINQNIEAVPPDWFEIAPGYHPYFSPRYEIHFSSDGKWLTGVPKDESLYCWGSGMSVGAKVQPVLKTPTDGVPAMFSPDASMLAIVAASGEIFAIRPGEQPRLKEPLATLPATDAHVVWSSDGESVYCFASGDVYFGEASSKLDFVLRAKAHVLRLSTVRRNKELVVVCGNQLTLVSRRLTIWKFLTLVRLGWPAIPATADSSEGVLF
jgi:hypothetical protein